MRTKLAKFILLISILLLLGYCQSTGGPVPKKIENFKGNLPTQDITTYRKSQKLLQEGKALYKRKLYDKSLAKAEASINKFATAEGWFLKGLNHSSKEDYGKAADAFKKAHELNNKDEQILLTYAISARLAGDQDSSLAAYEKLTNKHSQDATYRFQYGLTKKEAGKYQGAISDFKKAESLGFKPKDALYVHMAEAYAAADDDDRAEEYYKKAQKINPKNRWAKDGESVTSVKAGMRKGQKAMGQKNYSEAIKQFSRVEKKNPNLAPAKLYLGIAYYQEKKYNAAQAKLSQALAIDAELEDGWVYLSRSYEKSGNVNDQFKALNQGEKSLPKSAKIALAKGQYYESQGVYNDAISAYLKAKTLQPSFLPAYANATVVYLQEGRYREAKVLLQEAEVEIKAKDKPELERLQGLVDFASFEQAVNKHLAARRYKQAERALKKNSKYERYASYHNLKGKTCFRKNKNGRSKKRFNSCESNYEKALEIDKKFLPAMVNLNELYSFQLKKDYKRKSKTRSRIQKKSKIISKRIAASSSQGYVQGLIAGIAHEKKADYDAAILKYKGLKKKYPRVQVIKSRLAYCYIQKAILAANAGGTPKSKKVKKPKADYKLAFVYLKHAKQEDPKYPGLQETTTTLRENQRLSKHAKLITKAKEQERQKQWAQAAVSWGSLYKKIATPDVLYRQLKANLNAERTVEADKIFAKGKKRFKKHPKWPLVASRYHSDRKDFVLARKELNKYLKANSSSAEGYYRMGILDLKENKDKEAMSNFQQSLDKDNDFLPARIGVGVVLHKQKRYKASRETFNQVIREDKNQPLANLNLGVSYFTNDLFKEARKHFAKVVANKNLKADSLYYLGFIDYLENDNKKAEKNLRAALALAPEEIYLYGLYKTLARKKGKGQGAIVNEMVKRYPAGRYTALVLAKKPQQSKKSKQTVALGKFDWPRSIKDKAYIQNQRLYFFDKVGLHCYNLSSGATCFNKTFKLKPVALKLKAMIFVLFNDHIKTLHPHDGRILHSTYLPEGGAKSFEVINSETGFAFVVKFSDNNRVVSYNSDLMAQLTKGSLYQPMANGLLVASGKTLKFHSLNEKGDVKNLIESSSKFISIQVKGNRLLTLSDRKLSFYKIEAGESPGLKRLHQKQIKDLKAYNFSATSLAYIDKKKKLIILSTEERNIKLPKSRSRSAQVVIGDADQVIVYLGKKAYLLVEKKLIAIDGASVLARKTRSRQILFAQSYNN